MCWELEVTPGVGRRRGGKGRDEYANSADVREMGR